LGELDPNLQAPTFLFLWGESGKSGRGVLCPARVGSGEGAVPLHRKKISVLSGKDAIWSIKQYK